MSDDLFSVLIESIASTNSFFQTFWCQAAHPGAAIDTVLKACIRLGVRNPQARILDSTDFKSLPKNAINNRKLNVFYSPVRNYFPTEKSFIAPHGIIEANEKGKYDYELIQEGFALTKTELGIYNVEAVIERDNLAHVFFLLINRLPSIRVFWIKIAADWEDHGRGEFWTNEDLNTEESIRHYLTSHPRDTIANGHLALTVFSDAGQTNLTIDTHKTIKVLTKSAALQGRMAAQLRRLGFKQLNNFYSLEYGYHHWHYRPKRSKSRTRLVAALKNDGFALWRTFLPDAE
jgi:hypothetical protein